MKKIVKSTKKTGNKRPRLHGAKENFFKDSSLSIALITLFIICIFLQTLAGWKLHNENLIAHGHHAISHWGYLFTGVFWEDISSNWQAAFLQLGTLIILSSFLYQRGSPHSLDPRSKAQLSKLEQLKVKHFSWLYRHSLSIAFLLLFAVAFVIHIISGVRGYNEERLLTGNPPISIAAFMISAKFWATTLKTWQAEYMVITIYILLGIFLRQENSAESKPVESKNETTGKINV